MVVSHAVQVEDAADVKKMAQDLNAQVTRLQSHTPEDQRSQHEGTGEVSVTHTQRRKLTAAALI